MFAHQKGEGNEGLKEYENKLFIMKKQPTETN